MPRISQWVTLTLSIVSFHFAEPGKAYFERRALRRHARVLHLWALGVGAVISGDFFGWNFGLIEGGFGGMLIALAITTLLFAGLCFSIAEMSLRFRTPEALTRSLEQLSVRGAAISPVSPKTWSTYSLRR